MHWAINYAVIYSKVNFFVKNNQNICLKSNPKKRVPIILPAYFFLYIAGWQYKDLII